MKALVTGMIATYPVGGVLWDYAQYALGLERLGFEVFYLEDTGGPTYDPVLQHYGEDCSAGVAFLHESLAALSPTLAERWHFRAIDGRAFGLDARRIAAVADEADLFLNVSGSALLREEYMACPRKVLIDTDPGWNHFVNYPKWDRSPGWQGSRGYRAHDFFFTYAQKLGDPDCELPDMGLAWHKTQPLVVTDCWRPEPPGRTWTTVMTWDNFRTPIEHAGRVYGTKEREFNRVEALPTRVKAPLEVAVGGASPPVDRWRRLGWSVVDSHEVSRTPEEYRRYLQSSRGEFSVAKNLYAATRSGWFSCRSVCYLAAGRPVVLQDTGFSERLPTGEGLLAFATLDQAVEAIDTVEADYARHARAAREIARDRFEVTTVLSQMLRDIGLS